MEKPGATSLLRQTTEVRRPKPRGGGVLRMFKVFPMLTSGCKMAANLGKPGKGRPMLADKQAMAVTLFGFRRGRVSLAMQEDPRLTPFFLLELPLLTGVLHKEMASGPVKIVLESETRPPAAHRRRPPLVEEHVWAVYCNGRRAGYAVRRKQASDEEERRVMQLLRGVSIGAGVLPGLSEKETAAPDSEMTYMRARFERVVGSRDSESFYMISPDGAAGGVAELSIFLVRLK